MAAASLMLGATLAAAQPSRPLALRLADPADLPKADYVKAAATMPNGDVAVALDTPVWTARAISDPNRPLAAPGATPLAFSGGGIHRTAVDGRGAVYGAGWFSGSRPFPNQTLQARSTLSDVFLAKLDAHTGVPRWGAGLVSVEPASADNIAAGLAIDPSGSPWMGGQFFAALELAQSGQTSLVLRPAYRGEPTPRSGDGFVARFDPSTGGLR